MSEASEEKCPKCGEQHTKFALFAGQEALWDCGSVKWTERHGGNFAQSYECRGRELASLRTSLSAARQEVERMREAARKVKVGSYLDDGVLFRRGFTTTSCEALRELFVAAALLAQSEGEE